MRKFWMSAAALLVLGIAAAGGWLVLRDRSVDAPRVAATATETTTESASTTIAATAVAAAAQESVTAADTDDSGIQPGDRVLGDPNAPVTIIEYASLTCPHCATFHTETLPKLKSEYIDKGQVRLVFRDFPLDQVAFQASKLALCMPEDRYFNMLNVLFRSQSEWARAADPMQALSQIARTAGMSQEAFEQCMTDQAVEQRILSGYQEAQSAYDIRSTPSFIVNGSKHAGALTFEQFDEILKDELPDS